MTEHLREQAQSLPDALRDIDYDRLADVSDDFTGADLKRVVEDAKALYAFDRVQKREPAAMTDYFLRAIVAVRENKQRYARAEAQARINRPVRPTWFNPFASAMECDEE